jgi:NitT/TauT family transport system substrate-binding protein
MNPLLRVADRRALLACLVAAASVAVTACGSGDDAPARPGGSATPGPAEPVTIKVADVEGSPYSFLAFGVRKGFFADRGLDVELSQHQGGAAIVPGLTSGEYQIGGSNIVSIFLARSRGLPLQIVAPGTSVGSDADKDFSALVVPADSPIASVRDLVGRRIAVNTLKNVNDIVIKSNLQSQRADISDLKLTEMPFSAMLPALAQGRVDAAMLIEPFVTIAQSQGARVLLRPYVGAKPNLAIGTYSATEGYIREHPGVVKAFQEAAARTASYITDNPDEYREALPTITKLDPALASKVNIPVWSSRMDMDSLRFFADRMVRYGLVTTAPDVAAAVYTAR